MTSNHNGGGKLPGKTKYAGRRRAMTRKSGFSVHGDTSGGEFRRHHAQKVWLHAGDQLQVTFKISDHSPGDLLGYGMWFWHTSGIIRSIPVVTDRRQTLTEYSEDSWNKFGSIWQAQDAAPIEISFSLIAIQESYVAIYQPICGRIQHKHLDQARPELLRNMYQFAPEAIFLDETLPGKVFVEIGVAPSSTLCMIPDIPNIAVTENLSEAKKQLILKSCNRCGRYLPINVHNERDQLSFNNHCVAAHRRPCSHATFGRLRNIEAPSETLQLDYGYQLECRFCKKFEVNAAHNPQRSSAQMKEDGARRRAFELLLADLYRGTPQLRYRHDTGSELADDVWNRFHRACFNCGCTLKSVKDMNLDHTRPLALLWPLDGSATALCKACNSEKRDRPPSEFYSTHKLAVLAEITGIPFDELCDPCPNKQALDLLLRKLDWLFDEFLMRDEMIKERDGKITGELVVKALNKVIKLSPWHHHIDLKDEYDRHRRHK